MQNAIRVEVHRREPCCFMRISTNLGGVRQLSLGNGPYILTQQPLLPLQKENRFSQDREAQISATYCHKDRNPSVLYKCQGCSDANQTSAPEGDNRDPSKRVCCQGEFGYDEARRDSSAHTKVAGLFSPCLLVCSISKPETGKMHAKSYEQGCCSNFVPLAPRSYTVQGYAARHTVTS
jgi:hypothetical protein